MLGSLSTWRRYRARLLAGLAAPTLLALAGAAETAPTALPTLLPAAPAPVPAATVTALDLAACRRLALEKQPAVAAAHASLAAALGRQQVANNVRVPTFLLRDLPARRQQAALGVAVAQARVHQAELNTLYGVDYSYLSYLYARQQLEVADNALVNLRSLREVVDQAIKDGTRADLSRRDLKRLDVYALVAQGRREDAVEGAERALSALREALGVGPDFVLVLAGQRLPDVKVTPVKEEIVALALSRRPEMAMAVNGAEITGLEVCAQSAKRFHPSVATFAASGDLHADPLPAGSFDMQYRPAAVGLEMPGKINGSRAERVEQARSYQARAGSVVEKTRGLLTLEAEQAFLRWQGATRKLARYEKAAREARGYFKEQQRQFTPVAPKILLDPLLNAALLSGPLTAQVNETRYRQLLALAELERASGGGFCAGLDTAPPVKDDDNGNGNGTR